MQKDPLFRGLFVGKTFPNNISQHYHLLINTYQRVILDTQLGAWY